MAVGLIESQSPQADADMPAGCNLSGAVSGSGPEDKKAGKSRQANKKEAYAIKGVKQILALYSPISKTELSSANQYAN
ncbi:MAG: hypothetical protein LBU32_04100 [Clostridiales bacterium]|jgi:hypothetical protein|nr:hypothetical protein [Clostridiales bacterium]